MQKISTTASSSWMTAAGDCSLHCTSLPGLANLPPYSAACNKRTEFPAHSVSPSEHTLHLIPAFLHILSAIFYFPSPKSDQFQSCTGHGRVPSGSAKAVMLSLDSKRSWGSRMLGGDRTGGVRSSCACALYLGKGRLGMAFGCVAKEESHSLG